MTKQETITMYIESMRADLMERDRNHARRHHRAAHIGLHSSASAPSRRRGKYADETGRTRATDRLNCCTAQRPRKDTANVHPAFRDP